MLLKFILEMEYYQLFRCFCAIYIFNTIAIILKVQIKIRASINVFISSFQMCQIGRKVSKTAFNALHCIYIFIYGRDGILLMLLCKICIQYYRDNRKYNLYTNFRHYGFSFFENYIKSAKPRKR